MHVKSVTQGSLFFSTLDLDELWCQYFLEESIVTAAYRYMRYITHKPDAEHEEAIAVCEPNFDPCYVTDEIRHFAPVFDSAERQWHGLSCYFDTLTISDHDSFVQEICSDVRFNFLAAEMRKTSYIDDLLQIYRSAVDEFIMYHIKLWNVYVQDFSEVDRINGGMDLFYKFVDFTCEPKELQVVGNPKDSTQPSPALWIEYKAPESKTISLQILNMLYSFKQVVEPEYVHHLSYIIKDKLLLQLALLFYPRVFFASQVYPLAPASILSVPVMFEAVICDHYWIPSNAFKCDRFVCSECGQVRLVDDFTEEEFEEVFEKLQSISFLDDEALT